MTPSPNWQRFKQYFLHDEALGFSLDVSRMNFDDAFMDRMRPAMERAFDAMALLESGEIANPDEKRMVGHYWLRDPERAPGAGIGPEITATLERIREFQMRMRRGEIVGEQGQTFSHFLVIGIGGSALGPQLLADALGSRRNRMVPHFLDNTDPDGIRRVLGEIEHVLDGTLVLVISKSGGTPETANGMLETRAAYERRGWSFPRHAVAITGEGSKLDKLAQAEGWIDRLPMWDWVGGRTSVTAAVGLMPAALLGVDIDALLAGAAAMDDLTRLRPAEANPAALLALMWHWAGGGRGAKDMVILPYKDRLVLLSRYLQQLVMESIGKERDLDGKVVHQGLAVYGNKGSTDQHAYVQQLRDGLNNFFATFIEVLTDEAGSGSGGGGGDVAPVEIEPGAQSGDFLQGFFLGTRAALADSGRESITITIRELNAFSLGMLIALFERAVGFYASLVNINAYHQPGVEAGKKAARGVLDLQVRLLEIMKEDGGAKTAEGWAAALGSPAEAETIFKLLERLAANQGRGVTRTAVTRTINASYHMAL